MLLLPSLPHRDTPWQTVSGTVSQNKLFIPVFVVGIFFFFYHSHRNETSTLHFGISLLSLLYQENLNIRVPSPAWRLSPNPWEEVGTLIWSSFDPFLCLQSQEPTASREKENRTVETGFSYLHSSFYPLANLIKKHIVKSLHLFLSSAMRQCPWVQLWEHILVFFTE